MCNTLPLAVCTHGRFTHRTRSSESRYSFSKSHIPICLKRLQGLVTLQVSRQPAFCQPDSLAANCQLDSSAQPQIASWPAHCQLRCTRSHPLQCVSQALTCQLSCDLTDALQTLDLVICLLWLRGPHMQAEVRHPNTFKQKEPLQSSSSSIVYHDTCRSPMITTCTVARMITACIQHNLAYSFSIRLGLLPVHLHAA